MLGFRTSTPSVGKVLLHLSRLELASTHLRWPLEMLVGPGKSGVAWAHMHALRGRQAVTNTRTILAKLASLKQLHTHICATLKLCAKLSVCTGCGEASCIISINIFLSKYQPVTHFPWRLAQWVCSKPASFIKDASSFPRQVGRSLLHFPDDVFFQQTSGEHLLYANTAECASETSRSKWILSCGVYTAVNQGQKKSSKQKI